MPDPTPYNVSYSFSGYQALNPNRPLPAGPLDVEFANLAVTLGETISALADVRRTDGNLQNPSTNTWVIAGNLGQSDGGGWLMTGSSKSLSATLDRVRITTVAGTDTFDAGSINVSWE